mgnify:CR=1 FL=1
MPDLNIHYYQKKQMHYSNNSSDTEFKFPSGFNLIDYNSMDTQAELKDLKTINLMDDKKNILSHENQVLLEEIAEILKSNVLLIVPHNCNKVIELALTIYNISDRLKLPSLNGTPIVTIALTSSVYSCDTKTTIKFLRNLFSNPKIFSFRPGKTASDQFEFF